MTAAEQQISADSATRESTQARATVTDHRPRCGGPSGHGQRRPRLPCRTVDRCRTSLRQAGSARVRRPRLRVEVYVNSGHQVLSPYSYASEGPRAIKLVAEFGNLKVESLKLHHMKSIGLE